MEAFVSYVFRNQWMVFIIPALLLMGIAEFGFQLGLHLYRSQDEASKAQIGGMQGALLGPKPGTVKVLDGLDRLE